MQKQAHGSKKPSSTKSGPGRYHNQGNSRKQSAVKYPGTPRGKRRA